jgi:hypothetical protein
MNFFSQILGRTKPTSDNIAKLLAQAGADLETNRKRLAEAESALQRVAVMTADEHATTEQEQTEARRAIIRLEAKIIALQKGLDEAQKAERLEALKARAEAAKRRVDGDAPKLLDSYETTSRAIVEAVSELQAIDVEVEAVNAELRKAGLDPIETAEFRYRREPDQVIPEVRTKRTAWFRNVAYGGRDNYSVREEEVSVLQRHAETGELRPTDPSAFKKEVEHVTPEQRRPGRWLEGLAGSVRLPPARIGSGAHWPKG